MLRLQDWRDCQRDTSLHLRRISMEGENNGDSDPEEAGGIVDWMPPVLSSSVSPKQRSNQCYPLHLILGESLQV